MGARRTRPASDARDPLSRTGERARVAREQLERAREHLELARKRLRRARDRGRAPSSS
jgi:hypothetical protein